MSTGINDERDALGLNAPPQTLTGFVAALLWGIRATWNGERATAGTGIDEELTARADDATDRALALLQKEGKKTCKS